MKHKNKFQNMKLIPIAEALLIAVSYLAVGCLWILFSEKFMQQATSDADTMGLISLLKGLFYVFITAGLLLLLVYSRAKRAQKYQAYLEESEKRYRNLFYNSNAVQIIVDTETGSIHEANEAACKYYGYTPEEIKSKKIWDINTADPKAISERMQLTYESGKHSFEGRHRLSDGTIRNVEVFSGRMDLDGQRMVYSIIHDITERVLADEAIRSSEARLNRAQAMAHVGNWEIDLKERQIWASKEAFHIYGFAYESSRLPLQAAQDIVIEEDRQMMDKALQKLVENNERYDVVFHIRRENDGELRTLHSLAEIEYGQDGNPTHVVGVIQDITDMKEAEKKLLASEARYRNLFQNNYAVQLILDSETADIIDANPAAGVYYGFSLDELKKKKLWDINPSGEDFIMKKLKDTYAMGAYYLETKHIRSDGKICDVEVFSGRLVMDGCKAIYAIVHDISERKQAERELKESEERFRMLVENAPDAVFVQTDYRFAYVNKKTIEIFGAKTEGDLIGKYIPDFLSEGFRSKVEETINLINEAKIKVPAREEAIVRLSGESVDVEVSAIPIQYNKHDGALVFMRDITERKNMEKEKQAMEVQLRQKQKLESIGTLAGGVAHEINNPVNGIINYAQLIADDPNTNDQIKEYSGEIIHEGQRVAGIAKDLLSFSRQEKQAHSPADIRDIIERTVTLIRTVMRHDQIELDINIPEGLPSIKCRSQQIQQVLMNLLTNARDALNEKYKDSDTDKKIAINCSLFNREGRRWINIIVEDNGTGIPEEIREKIFDPFFTTKPREIGTGLGLSISHGIVKDHHGELYFETRTGEYTRAVLELPVDNGWTL